MGAEDQPLQMRHGACGGHQGAKAASDADHACREAVAGHGNLSKTSLKQMLKVFFYPLVDGTCIAQLSFYFLFLHNHLERFSVLWHKILSLTRYTNSTNVWSAILCKVMPTIINCSSGEEIWTCSLEKLGHQLSEYKQFCSSQKVETIYIPGSGTNICFNASWFPGVGEGIYKYRI
jgi:hypothetical protein